MKHFGMEMANASSTSMVENVREVFLEPMSSEVEQNEEKEFPVVPNWDVFSLDLSIHT